MKPRYWVTVCEAEQCFGGPEEGGWWYDQYFPIRHLKARTWKHAQRLRMQEIEKLGGPEAVKPKYGVNDHEWHDVTIDRKPGGVFPVRRPHYE